MTVKNEELRQGTTRLRPRANIIRMLGDELISSDTVAVTELVKNSYDADATRVSIRFSGDISNGEGSIEVIDDGTGMSLDTVTSTWLEPASSTKKLQRHSARGRRMLGEKGVGRFAAARLSNRVEMITREAGAGNEIVVTFEWDSFRRSEYLDEIECSWEERQPERLSSGSGTVLRLLGINSEWNEENLEELRDSLSRIISPFETVKDFSVELDLPNEFRDISGPVRPSELLTSPHYSIKGKYQADGTYELEYRSGTIEGDKLNGKVRSTRKFKCGPFQIELRVWDRDPGGIKTLAEAFNLRGTEVRKRLDRQTGVYIYRDGFRVLPYGEPNNDWLRLDIRRVQNPTLRVSNNQVVGCLLISADNNPGLKDQTNREGVVTSQAFDDLKELAMAALSQLEQRRYKERRSKQPKPTKRHGLFSEFDLNPVRVAIRKHHPEDSRLLQVVDRIERDLSQRTVTVQEGLARYRRLATLGELIDILLHDGKTPLNQINSEAEIAIRSLAKSEYPESLTAPLTKRFKFILQRGGVIAGLFRKIEPFGGRRRGRPAPATLESIIKSAFELHEGKITELGVVCDLPETETTVTVDPVEMHQVIFNFLDNSLYWLEHEVDKDERRIIVQVQRTSRGEIEIVYGDSGPGIPEDFRDQIFNPYFSLKPQGAGLGLFIAGEIVAEYDGDLELIDGPLTGACFKVTLRRRLGP